MLDLYLRELERELARSLPPEDVAARLAEAEAHLADGVAGRVELGMELGDAQHEAIESFGTARRVATAGRPTHEGRPTARVACLGAGYALAIFFVLFGWRLIDALPQLNLWLFQSWLALGLGFAVAAFRARRPRPLAIGLTAFGATTLTWLFLGTTSLNLYAFGGTGLVPPGSLARMMADDRRLLTERMGNRAIFEAGWTTIRGPQGIEGLHNATGYQAPVVQQPSYQTSLKYESVPTAKEALRAWSDVRQRGSNLFETESLAANLTAAGEARAAPLKNLLSIASDLFLPNVGIAAFAVLIDYAFGGLGVLAFRLRRPRRTGVA